MLIQVQQSWKQSLEVDFRFLNTYIIAPSIGKKFWFSDNADTCLPCTYITLVCMNYAWFKTTSIMYVYHFTDTGFNFISCLSQNIVTHEDILSCAANMQPSQPMRVRGARRNIIKMVLLAERWFTTPTPNGPSSRPGIDTFSLCRVYA